MVRVGKIAESSFFNKKKMVQKGYCRNEGLGLAWDHMEVRQVAPFNTTNSELNPDRISCETLQAKIQLGSSRSLPKFELQT